MASKISAATQKVLDEIAKDVARGAQYIAPGTYSHFYGRAAVSAGFRIARARGMIGVRYISAAGTPVYCAPAVGEAKAAEVSVPRAGRAASKDWALIGLPEGTDDAEVARGAYRAAMVANHPDLNPQAGDRAALVNAAWDRVAAAMGW